MALSETQVFGFSENVQELYVKERAMLKAAGYDVDEMLRILKKVHEETVALNAQQESLKRQLRETSIKLREFKRKLYNLTSGYIDAAMTAVEKSSPAAKIIRRLRSRIHRPGATDEEPAVQPVPEKTS